MKLLFTLCLLLVLVCVVRAQVSIDPQFWTQFGAPFSIPSRRQAASPWEFYSETHQFSSDPSQTIDYVWGWAFNRDGRLFDQPIYGQQVESRFVPGAAPAGLLELHGNYTSIDRKVSYRPWGLAIDLNNHEAALDLPMRLITLRSRVSETPFIQLFSNSGEIIIRSQGANPLQLLGGAGNVHLRLNPEQAVFLSSAEEASGELLTRNSPALFLSGYAWNGQRSLGLNTVLSTVVESADEYEARLSVGPSDYRFSHTGTLQASAFSLGSGVEWTKGEGDPSGTCRNGSLFSRTSDGQLFNCFRGHWRKVPLSF